ncbi:MAG: hypothetical protein NT154_33815, partial [Verrucomicrobia bacterium]|nr:hypothetical protein [Verrucomicrobiota bacterium]
WRVWSPEADEWRFFAGLPIVILLIVLVCGRGLLGFMGPYPVLASFALWCVAYMAKFRKRLEDRGELRRVMIASAAFFAMLLGVILY